MYRSLAILAAAALAIPAQASAAHHTTGGVGVHAPAAASIVTDNKDPDRLAFLPEVDDTVLVVRAVP